MCRAVLGDPETEPRKKEEEGHKRERGQQQVPATKRVDGVEGRDGEEPVDDTKAQRGAQCGDVAPRDVLEDLGSELEDDVSQSSGPGAPSS